MNASPPVLSGRDAWLATKTRVLADEMGEPGAMDLAIYAEAGGGCISIYQGNDHIAFPVEDFEQFAAEVMGVAMAWLSSAASAPVGPPHDLSREI